MALQIARIDCVFISMNGRLGFPMLCQKDPVCSLFLEPDLLCWGSETVGLGSHKAVYTLGKTHQAGLRVAVVVEFFKLIHPHFCGSDTVGQGLAARIGSLLREDVAHVGARVCFQSATTLPDLQ